ncbi:hypothetical protein [Kordiimonas marina]|uniref:hypothetical protein n=1 Tax=Kordiimonas marina TaxID=2872312 RepID=UPI001FF66064|nr:hypothetical protein [Kordiimonas marina]MCJ9430364.1 hypothetical protein [Kordiimonas marina]
MDTIYFVIFCLAVAFVIFWSLRNDDLADFDDTAIKDKKFTLSKGGKAKDSNNKGD